MADVDDIDAAQALLAVKTLGRNPTGSESLATAATLSTLLSFTTKFGEQTDAASEALRCIANTLLLFDHARTTFTDAQVGGGEVCLNLLDVRNLRIQCISLNVDISIEIYFSSSNIHRLTNSISLNRIWSINNHFVRRRQTRRTHRC